MGFFTHKTEVSDDLQQHGIRGKATVEKADMAGGMEYSGYMSEKNQEGLLTGERTMVKYKLQLRVELPDREPYLAGVKLPVPGPKIRYMSGGSVCEVLVDPNKPDHLAIDWNGTFQQGTVEQMAAANPLIAAAMKGAGVDIAAVSQMQRTAMEQGQTRGQVIVGGQLASGFPTAAKPDPLDQLKKLAELHDSGVVTDEEFAAEKAKLLNS
jgi:putative oligomerization/nucleic acid binding protein